MDYEKQVGDIMDLISEYQDKEDRFYQLLDESGLEEDGKEELRNLFLDEAWFGMLKQKILYVVSNEEAGVIS